MIITFRLFLIIYVERLKIAHKKMEDLRKKMIEFLIVETEDLILSPKKTISQFKWLDLEEKYNIKPTYKSIKKETILEKYKMMI